MSESPWEAKRLTQNEREVLTAYGEGKTTTEIATLRGIAIKTVRHYCLRIRQKLGLKNMHELVHLAVQASGSPLTEKFEAMLDDTECIEIHFFDGRGKLIQTRKFRAE
jgi:DNA-binding CsgD family transcriptional regulator